MIITIVRSVPFVLASRRPPLGYAYVLLNHDSLRKDIQHTCLDLNGHVHKVPKYYKEFLWSPRELAQFSLQAQTIAVRLRELKESYLDGVFGHSPELLSKSLNTPYYSKFERYFNKLKDFYDRKDSRTKK